jgi:hypothetical protein
MARMRDQIHQMDIVFVAIPHEFGGSMAAMPIKKKDPWLAISISLREEYLMQPSQANVIGCPPILRSGIQRIRDLAMLEPRALH